MDFFLYNNHPFRAQNAIATSSLRINSFCFNSVIFYLACLLSNCLCHQSPKSSDLNLLISACAVSNCVYTYNLGVRPVKQPFTENHMCLTWMFVRQLFFQFYKLTSFPLFLYADAKCTIKKLNSLYRIRNIKSLSCSNNG